MLPPGRRVLERLKAFCIVALLAGGAALLPAGGRGDNTAVVNINQGNLGIQLCGNSCVQVLQQYNIAVVFVSQGPDFAPALGAAYLSPDTQDFGPVVHAKTKDFTLINSSSRQPLLVAAIGVSGANPEDFSISNNCGIVLRPGEQCTIHMVLRPLALGPRNAVLAVRDSAPDSPQRVSVGGTGVAPTLLPDSLQFGSAAIGIVTAAKTATLHNPGTDPLTVQSVGFEGANASEFHAGPCSVVPAGASCVLPVTFQPADAGNRSADLTVHDDGLGGPRRVSLQGIGVPLQVSPRGFDFGALMVGTASQPQELVLENRGISSLVLNRIAFDSGNPTDFAFTTSCGALPASLPPGGHCVVDGTFRPSVPGPRSSTLAIQYTAGLLDFDAAATAVGSGTQPGFSVSPASLDFGASPVARSVTQSLTVTNSGTAPTRLRAINLVGAAPGDFTHAGSCDTLAGDLDPGASCQVNVTFTPHAAGARVAELKFSDNAPGTPHLVGLAGRGFVPAPPPVQAPPAAHASIATRTRPIVQIRSAAPPVTTASGPSTGAGSDVSAGLIRGPDADDNPPAATVLSSTIAAAPLAHARPLSGIVVLSGLSGPCLVTAVSPMANMIAWLAVVAILLLIGVGIVGRRRLREGRLPD